MRNSIRMKLFISVSSLIVFYVFVSWLLNSQLLDKYYYYNKKNMLEDRYKAINSIYKGDPLDVALEFEKIERNEGLHIIIVDKSLEVIYNSFVDRRQIRERMAAARNNQPYGPIQPEMINRNKLSKVIAGKVVFERINDTRVKSEMLQLLGRLDTGEYISISTPLAQINESANAATRFNLLTGIVTLLLGTMVVMLFSRRFTGPILELNHIAQRIAMLDFSKRYKVVTNDEIGELGKSINSLSVQLEQSISELKTANEKLMEDIERKRQIDEMRKEFISSVSHELKTPIALVQGYAEGLKLNVVEDAENKLYYCDVIIDEAHKMNRLVKQLLDLSQMESGNADLELVEFEIVPMINKVIKKNWLIFKEKDISVSVDAEGNPLVKADIYRIEQVLNNFLTNAVNHVDAMKTVIVRAKDLGEKIRVTVFNTGSQIPEEYQEQIWKSFYKVDKARTREYGGTGLGLSIIRAIQEAHHNAYGFNNVNGGVEFWFELNKVCDAVH